MCNSLTVGISVTGADRVGVARRRRGPSGEHHRIGRDKQLDLPASCSRRPPGISPSLRRHAAPGVSTVGAPRVVYDFTLPPLPGDEWQTRVTAEKHAAS